MYTSPTTPTGTGSSRSSSTYTCVFQIGFPIGTRPLPSSFFPSSPPAPLPNSPLILAHTVVSVGPYALIIRPPLPHLSTNSSPHASPATISVSIPASTPSPAFFTPAPLPRLFSTPGGNVTCVTPCLLKPSTSPSPIRSSSPRITSRPPPSSVTSISDIDASKL